MIGGGSGVVSPSGIVVTTTAAGTSLGGGSVSAGNTSTAANVSITPTPSTPIYNTTGPSIRQLGGGVASPTGIRTIASVSTGSAGSDGSESASSNTNYKLSIASMLLAMKNQALGALSLGGSKSGGSVTENISGINLG